MRVKDSVYLSERRKNQMKKWIAGLLIVCLAASLTACKERVDQAADSETTDIKTGQEDEGCKR